MKSLIIGGGLSGLALANKLEENGIDYQLLEARARFGGRIKTEQHRTGYFDMGPAWFWPGQPRIAALTERLGLEKFHQFADGDLTYENERGQVQRGRGFASMEGSWRLAGGFGALVDALLANIPMDRRQLNANVAILKQGETGVAATLASGETITADHVILSLPPRIAANIVYEPTLPAATISALQNIPTWMAAQAKAVAVYDTPFWRANGVSGDAQSRHGPMVEIHDASAAQGGPYALFGFLGVPPQARLDQQALQQQIMSQLVRLFGPEAREPVTLFVKDWARDPQTATKADQTPIYAYPSYGLPPSMVGHWGGQLHFSGTEVAPEFGGYLEGALEAAENTLRFLTQVHN
ncbi:MAG: FAD-dependent oxidoreductase [Roseobacter sp.]